MILTFEDLSLKYATYSNVRDKIGREVKNGNLTPIARGLYETDKNVNGKYLAGRICGPSYLSLDYALATYSLIPETVCKTFTSATFRKNKSKRYENAFGVFLYRDIPSDVYPLGVEVVQENGYVYQIATPEKALCDKLYTLPPIMTIKELKSVLFDDLRIDENDFWQLNLQDILQIAPIYRCNTLKTLCRLIEGGK